MQCPTCGKTIRCLDSRPKLSYSPDLREKDKVPVRERKYVCLSCELTFITREYVFLKYASHDIKDKRIKKK